MRITAKLLACAGAIFAIILLAPSTSFATPLDASVVYDLHVVSVDVDIGKNITASEIKHENENLVARSGGDDAERRSIGVSYLIENAGITDKAFTKLDVAKARGPPLLC